jgi:dolichol-phosphate mannosyltransferase
VLGSRYVEGGSIVGWNWRRRLLSWGANFYCRVVLGLRVRDCTAGYRCYTRQLLSAIELDHVFSQGYSFQVEMLYRCVKLGFPVTEVPIRFEDRIAGESKVSEGEVRKALLAVLRLRLLLGRNRPRRGR